MPTGDPETEPASTTSPTLNHQRSSRASQPSDIQTTASRDGVAVDPPLQNDSATVSLPDNDVREATELQARPVSQLNQAQPERQGQPPSADAHKPTEWRRFQNGVRLFWSRQIAITVGHDDCRDHFGWSFQRLKRFFLLNFPFRSK